MGWMIEFGKLKKILLLDHELVVYYAIFFTMG